MSFSQFFVPFSLLVLFLMVWASEGFSSKHAGNFSLRATARDPRICGNWTDVAVSVVARALMPSRLARSGSGARNGGSPIKVDVFQSTKRQVLRLCHRFRWLCPICCKVVVRLIISNGSILEVLCKSNENSDSK